MTQRVDNKLVELGLAQSRERAKALIMEGVVLLDGVKVQKASDQVRDGQLLTLKENPIPFVSRGGLKLEKAISGYGIDLSGLVCVDIGASTGGFTECMLMHGAKKVFAVDVGYGQLDWKLRNDERVVCMERHNARLMEPDWFDSVPEFASIDVSFISIKLILPRLHECLSIGGEAVVLVKPQFEAGRDKVGKNGVVRDIKTHIEVLLNSIEFACENGFSVKGVDFSPITGPKGNIEFLLYLSHTDAGAEQGDRKQGIKVQGIMSQKDLYSAVQRVTRKAHDTLL
ncbi:MAG: TlyA family RNA methyltransferase [Christensenellaceae bacterium]|nr:TlyA family RNA methyltransferase [Christensenellaceae bacterium]